MDVVGDSARGFDVYYLPTRPENDVQVCCLVIERLSACDTDMPVLPDPVVEFDFVELSAP